jgi:hypothetical protein
MDLAIFMLVLLALFFVVPLIVSFFVLLDFEQTLDRPRYWSAILINLYGMVMLLLIGLIFVFLDGEAFSLSPIGLIWGVLYTALFGLLLTFRRPTWFKIAVIAVIIIFPLAIRPIDYGTYKPFLRKLDQVKNGMTIEQVDAIMAGYRAEKGTRFSTPVCPEPGNSTLITECARYYAPQPNLDRAIVAFRDGHVIRVYYDND